MTMDLWKLNPFVHPVHVCNLHCLQNKSLDMMSLVTGSDKDPEPHRWDTTDGQARLMGALGSVRSKFLCVYTVDPMTVRDHHLFN